MRHSGAETNDSVVATQSIVRVELLVEWEALKEYGEDLQFELAGCRSRCLDSR